MNSSGERIADCGEGIPAFAALIGSRTCELLTRFPVEEWREGDCVVTNDPWIGTGHLPDMAMVTPIFHGGTLVGFAGTAAHLPDIGGTPSVGPTELLSEGLLIPPVHLYRAGRLNDELVSVLRANVRLPAEVWGDLQAQLAANSVGRRRAVEFLTDTGQSDFEALAGALHGVADRAMRRSITRIPDGRYTATVDADGIEGQPTRIACAITVAGDTLVVAYAGSSPQVTHAITFSTWPLTNGPSDREVTTGVRCASPSRRRAASHIIDPDHRLTIAPRTQASPNGGQPYIPRSSESASARPTTGASATPSVPHMLRRLANQATSGSHDLRSDMRPPEETPALRRAALPGKRNPDGNSRLTGISAGFVLPLFLVEVVTVVLGVKSVITLHVVIGLILLGPALLKLASVTYRIVSYYRSVGAYQQRGRPTVGLRLLGAALGVLFVLLMASGLVLIVGPNGAHSPGRAIHVVTAYLVVLLLVVHLAIHFLPAARMASADMRPRTAVRGARSRWLALLVSLAAGGVLALFLGGQGSTYLHQYYPGSSPQRSTLSNHRIVVDRGPTRRIPGKPAGITR
jgi:hypothetical protein